jgi:hypothetical protein
MVSPGVVALRARLQNIVAVGRAADAPTPPSSHHDTAPRYEIFEACGFEEEQKGHDQEYDHKGYGDR